MKIRDLITQDKATLSFEVFPPKKDTDFADVEAAALGIAAFKPDYMSVTYGAGGSTKGHTIQLAREIQEKYDVPTIAHLTCVCASKEGIKTALADMKNAGIENILALRGDIPKNYDGQVFAEFSHHQSWWSSSRRQEISAWAEHVTLRYTQTRQISTKT